MKTANSAIGKFQTHFNFWNLLWTIIGYSNAEQMSFEKMLNAWVLIKEQEMI